MFEVLLVDDNPSDIGFMKEALEGTDVSIRTHATRDGGEALAFLRREGDFRHAPRPNLILLDLNMPRKGGLETLAEMKADPALRGIPTVILSSSKREPDVRRAYDLQAQGFVEKPLAFDDFIAVIGGIERFWREVVRQPVPAPAANGIIRN